MLFGSGRILVAAAGAIVLVVVAVYAVRSVWWDPTSKPQQLTLPPATTSQTDTSAPETAGANPGGDGIPTGGAAGADSSASSTSEPGSTDGSTTEKPFTATTEKVNGLLGTVLADVEVPQVSGGDPAVAAVFNDEMKKALDTQAESLTAGKLEGRPGSGVRIGQRVLSGVLRTSAVNLLRATSSALVSTVVVDSDSGNIITLSSLFDDLTEGLQQLATQAKTLGPSSAAGSSFDATKVQPTEAMFEHWSAEAEGMRVFLPQGEVAPNAAGIVEITIPWDKLGGVLKSGVAQIVSS